MRARLAWSVRGRFVVGAPTPKDGRSRCGFRVRRGAPPSYSVRFDPLSPAQPLVCPEPANRARAQLVAGGPTSSAAPLRQPEQPPRPLRPPRVPQRADRAEPVERTRPLRSKGSVIVAVIALAAGLGGAAAIWARYNDGASGSRGMEQAPFRPRRERSPATAVSERGETTTARASKQGVAGHRYVRRATRSRRKGIGGSGLRSAGPAANPSGPRPAALHPPGAAHEP